MPRRIPVATLLALALLAAGLLAAVPSRAGGHAVEIADFAFSPATLTITAGETVTWTNSDDVIHTATSTTGVFDSGDLAQGASYSVTFTTPGTYDYLCTPHPTMTGRIVVEAAATAPPAPAATAAPSGGLPNVAMTARDDGTPLPALGVILLAAGALLLARSRVRPSPEI